MKLHFKIDDFPSKEYHLGDSIGFKKVNESFGELSNMAPLPIEIANIKFLTSEALYQSMRYPDVPEIQRIIIDQKSPMGAKMKSIKYREIYTRRDWTDIMIDAMFWCLRMKLSQNWEKFSDVLIRTGEKQIVEDIGERKDIFWGAKRDGDQYIGRNVLGRLLMILREQYAKKDHKPPKFIALNFECSFLGVRIPTEDDVKIHKSLVKNKTEVIKKPHDTTQHLIDYTQIEILDLNFEHPL